MCRHLTIIVRNEPGEVLRIAEYLERKEVNIIAFHISYTGPQSGYVQLACDDHVKALASLSAKYKNFVFESEVIAIRAEHQPGSLARILSIFKDYGININNAYQTINKDGMAIIIIEPDPTDLSKIPNLPKEDLEIVNSFEDLNGHEG